MTELLADILNNPRAGKAIENSRIVLLWNQCVSAEIAKQTEPVKVSNRILVVETKSPVWAQELNFLKIRKGNGIILPFIRNILDVNFGSFLKRVGEFYS